MSIDAERTALRTVIAHVARLVSPLQGKQEPKASAKQAQEQTDQKDLKDAQSKGY